MSSIGKRIKQQRKSRGLTQEDLAGPNLSPAMISLIERDMTNPSLKSLEHLANKLGISVNYLLDESPNQISPKENVKNSISMLKGLINFGKYKEAERIFLDIDEDKIDYTYKGILLKLKGDLYVKNEMYQEAIDEYKTALIFFTPYDIEEYVNIYCQISTCYKLLNSYQLTIENALYGLILLKSNYCNNPLLKLTLYFNLSHAYCKINEFNKGLEVITEALDFINESNFSYNEGLFFMLKGLAHLYLKNYTEGIEANKRALSLLNQENHQLYVIGSLTNLGILYRKVQDYQSAVQNLKESLKISTEKNLEWYQLNNNYELAITYTMNNNLEDAEEICKNQIHNSSISCPIKIKLLLLLSHIKFILMSYDEALKYVNDAQKHILELNNSLLLAKAYSIKSKILSSQGFINEANSLLNKAIQIYKNESYDSLDFI